MMDAVKAALAVSKKKRVVFITAVALLYLVLSTFGLLLTRPDEPLSPLWLSTAAMIAALFYCPRRNWAIMLISGAVAGVAAHGLVSALILASLPFVCISLGEAAFGAWLLQQCLNPRDPLNGIVPWLKFLLISVVLTPALGALAAALIISAAGGPFFPSMLRWFIAEASGILTLTPVGLLCRRADLLQIGRRTGFNLLLVIILTLAISFLSLRFLPFPFTFIMLPLLYGAIQLPRLDAFVLFLVTALALFVPLACGWIVINLPYNSKIPLLINIPLLMLLLPSHAMAMSLYAIRQERGQILQSEIRFRHAMEYSAIGMALVSLEGGWMQVNKSLCRFLGYGEHELLRLSFQEITYPDDLSSDLMQLNDLINGKIESYTMEKRYIRSDGDIVWALLAMSLVRDPLQRPLYFISQIEDISEIKRNNLINQRLMERITLANEAGGVAIWEWNLETQTYSWDKRMLEIYAVQPGEEIDYDFWLDRVVAEDRTSAEDTLNEALENNRPFLLGFRIRTPDGEIRHIRSLANVLKNEQGRVVRILGVNLDMTGEARLREALHEEKERLHITLNSIGDAVISLDSAMRITFMNPVAEKMTGWRQQKAGGRHIDDVMRISLGAHGPRLPLELINSGGAARPVPSGALDLVLNSRSGPLFDIQYSCTPLKDLKGEPLGAVLVIRDVSESRQLLQKLSYSATHDVLTGLPNRANFQQHLDAALKTAALEKRRHALSFIDLDRFKLVNDAAGHAAGDALLLEMGALMQGKIRQYDCLARLGGDEFGLILTDCPLPEAQILIQRIIDAINDFTFNWRETAYRIGGSAGITLISADNNDGKDVMAQADAACYAAKHHGRGRIKSLSTVTRHNAPH